MKSVKYQDNTLILKDGTKLHSKHWMPHGNGPWPALLMRQPYGKELGSTVTYAHPSWWASQGYLVIIQDVRGQGSSEGEFKGFEQESSDTTHTHKWVRSLPECNGLLGTFGFSYQGFTQLIGEPGSSPPDCLAPAMTGINEGNHWSSEGGAFWWHIGISWGLQLAAQKLQREKNLNGWQQIRESLETQNYLTNGLNLLQKFDSQGMAYKWLKNSESTQKEWKSHDPLQTWLKQPMLLIGGWWDPHLNGILEIHQKSIEAGGCPELHIGPATHLQWWEETNQIQLDFFNRFLKRSTSTKFQSTKKLWNLTSNTWEDSNLSKRTLKEQNWSLSSTGLACANSNDGKLAPGSIGEGFLNIVHDPWRPVPAIGGHLSPCPGEAERSFIDKRGDVATFTSDPFEKEQILESIPTLSLNAKSDKTGFDLCIVLSIIYKDQCQVHQLSTGVLRVLGKDSNILLKREISLQPFLAKIYEGSRIRLSISGAFWPAIAINPGTYKSPCIFPNPNCSITTIFLDLSQSTLKLDPIFKK